MVHKIADGLSRRGRGLCKDCSEPAKLGRSLCDKHMNAAIARRKANSRHKKEHGLCDKCANTPAESGMSMCRMHLDKYADAISERNRNLKLDTFNAYGGPKCACLSCPQREFAMLSMLTIDHINGGGNKHRKEILKDRGGTSFYRWLKKQGYPSGYQVMCWNCNLSKRYGPCEHMSSLTTI